MKHYIKKNSKFLKLNKDVSTNRLNTLLGKCVYADLFEHDGVVGYYLKLISIDGDIITFTKDEDIINISISNIRGIEELINYNDIDFQQYVGKKVLLTDLHDESDYVEIEYIENDDLALKFLFEDNNGSIIETRDYPFPKYFIKDIKE